MERCLALEMVAKKKEGKMPGFNPPKGFDNRVSSRPNKLVPIAALILVVSVVGLSLMMFQGQPHAVATEAVIPVASTELGSVTLYALNKPINSGDRIELEDIQEVYWPVNQVPEGAIRDKSELKSMFAKTNIAANLPLQRQSLTDRPAMQALPVTPGNRAVTIQVDATSGIEGHTRPGTYVDVILTYHVNGVLTSKVIVQNTRVLSLQGDTTTASEQDPGASRKGNVTAATTVTLDMVPRDALAVTTARQLGRLSLMMRSSGDQVVLAEDEIDQNQIGPDSAPAVSRSIRAPKSSPQCVKGTFQLRGKDYQLNCDGSMVLLDDIE